MADTAADPEPPVRVTVPAACDMGPDFARHLELRHPGLRTLAQHNAVQALDHVHLPSAAQAASARSCDITGRFNSRFIEPVASETIVIGENDGW